MQYLAVLRVKPGTTREQLGSLAKPEAAAAWEMVCSGALRSIHFIEGPVGAVLLFEAGDRAEADALVGRLPMVQQGLLNIEVLPLVPFTGFAALFASSS
jgi:hypothetical protein